MAKPRKHINQDQINPFFNLRDDEFEDLCRDLFGKNNEVIHARKLFGKGYNQYGGDILVQIDDATSYVIQCKHYPKTDFSRSNIKEACDLFISHWESHWKPYHVKRFYLLVSRPLTTEDQSLAIQEVKDRFYADYKLNFIYWDQDDIRNELKHHRDLVLEYLGNYWEYICVPETNSTVIGFFNDNVANRLINRDFDQMAGLLSEKTIKEIEPIRQLARSGKQQQAIEKFHELKTKSFDYLDNKTRAELLSLQIRLEFPHSLNLKKARILLDQIISEDPDFQTNYLKAWLTSEEEGLNAGLKELINCTDTFTLNLKLVLLINTDRCQEALKLYETEFNNIEVDAETIRLYALILLTLNRITEAENAIEEAYNLQPEWEGVRWAKAIILYHSSLGESVFSDGPLLFPRPLPWQLIRSDQESQNKRKEAARLFKDLLTSESKNEETLRQQKVWLLACLADDPDYQSEANKYAADLLKTDSTNSFILIWALTRGLNIDFSAAQKAIEGRIEKLLATNRKSVEVNELIVLIPIYLRNSQITQAKKHLERIKFSLEQNELNDLYPYWKCQIAIAEGNYSIIEKRLSQEILDVQMRQNIQIAALGEAYHKHPNRNNRRSFEKRLQKICRKSRDPHYLWLYCQLCHAQQKWHEVLKYGNSLIHKNPTEHNLRLICDAYYQTRQPEKCLELIEKNRHLFSNNELPIDFVRLEAHCWLKAGRPTLATEKAREIFARDKSAENLLTLVETSRHIGDWFGIEKAVEQSSEIAKLSPFQQLKISQLVAPVNQKLASQLWRQAKERINDAGELTNAAFAFGNRLGLSNETAKLERQMMENAELLDFAKTKEIFSNRNKHLEEIKLLYLEGKIPLHIYSEKRSWALTIPFHFLPNANNETDDFNRKEKILIRSGNRRSNRFKINDDIRNYNFHLDISDLLLLHHFELLESLEELAPLYINKEIIPFLNLEIEQLSQTNPERAVAAGIILQAHEKGDCKILKLREDDDISKELEEAEIIKCFGEYNVRFIKQAIKDGSFVVDYLPLRNIQNGRIIRTPESFTEVLRGWSAIMNTLKEEGILTAETIDRYNREIRKEFDDETIDESIIPIGSKVYLTGLTALQIAELGSFKEMSRYFQVFVDDNDYQFFIDEKHKADVQQDLIQWLRGLQEHLRKGFEKDTYRGISVEKLNSEPDNSNPPRDDYRMRSVLELSLFKGEQNDLVVVDDRWLSGFNNINNHTSLLTIFEVLQLLNENKIIDSRFYYQKLNQLREENFRYLPLLKNELLFQLEKANKLGTKQIKTPELIILRKYIADCLLDEQWLQKPYGPIFDDNYAEINFVFECQRATVEAIGTVWQQENSVDEAHKNADILLFNFYIGRFSIRHFLPISPEHEAGSWHLASDFSDLSLQAMGILIAAQLDFDQKIERLTAFFNWLSFIFREHINYNQIFVSKTVEILTDYFTGALEAQNSGSDFEFEEETKQSIYNLKKIVINHLPPKIKDLLFDNPKIQQTFDFVPQLGYAIGEMEFSADELWNNVAEALSSGKSKIISRSDPPEIIKIETVESNELAPKIFLIHSDGKRFLMADRFSGLLLPDSEKKNKFITSLRRFFDCSEKDYRHNVNKILELQKPAAIIEEFSKWIGKSAAYSYEELAEKIRIQNNFNWPEILDFPLTGLKQHFYLDDDFDDLKFYENFSSSINQLLINTDLATALDRTVCFPSAIPKRLINKLQTLPLLERKALLNKLHLNWTSPVQKLHYLTLIMNVLSEDKDSLQNAHKVAEQLFKTEKQDEENLEFEIFKSLLRLVNENFSSSPETKGWRTSLKLSLTWAHSSKIYNMIIPLAKNKKRRKDLLRYLNSYRGYWNRNIFDYNPEFWSDSLNPNYVERESFLGIAAGSLFTKFSDRTLNLLNIPSLLKKLCLVEVDGKIVPIHMFWKDIEGKTNVTGSFINKKGFEEFNNLLQKKNAFLSGEIIHEYLNSLIEGINKTPLETTPWIEIIFLSNNLPLNKNVQPKFIEVIEKLDFRDIWNDNSRLALVILSFLVNQKSYLSEEMNLRLATWLEWIVERLSEKYPEKPYENSSVRKEQEDIAITIAEIAAWLSVEPFKPVFSSYQWNELIYKLGHIWMNLPILLEPTLLRLWLDLPVEQIQGIGKNLFLSRIRR